jgi:hypothetical protein
MLNTLEPRILPSASPASPRRAATTLVASSGSEVPTATTVRPITVSLMPRSARDARGTGHQQPCARHERPQGPRGSVPRSASPPCPRSPAPPRPRCPATATARYRARVRPAARPPQVRPSMAPRLSMPSAASVAARSQSRSSGAARCRARRRSWPRCRGSAGCWRCWSPRHCPPRSPGPGPGRRQGGQKLRHRRAEAQHHRAHDRHRQPHPRREGHATAHQTFAAAEQQDQPGHNHDRVHRASDPCCPAEDRRSVRLRCTFAPPPARPGKKEFRPPVEGLEPAQRHTDVPRNLACARARLRAGKGWP